MYAGLVSVPKGVDMTHAACGWDSFVACSLQGNVYAYTLQAPEPEQVVAMPSNAVLSALAAGEKHR